MCWGISLLHLWNFGSLFIFLGYNTGCKKVTVIVHMEIR